MSCDFTAVAAVSTFESIAANTTVRDWYYQYCDGRSVQPHEAFATPSLRLSLHPGLLGLCAIAQTSYRDAIKL